MNSTRAVAEGKLTVSGVVFDGKDSNDEKNNQKMHSWRKGSTQHYAEETDQQFSISLN